MSAPVQLSLRLRAVLLSPVYGVALAGLVWLVGLIDNQGAILVAAGFWFPWHVANAIALFSGKFWQEGYVLQWARYFLIDLLSTWSFIALVFLWPVEN